jgi:hypothetical protein
LLSVLVTANLVAVCSAAVAARERTASIVVALIALTEETERVVTGSLTIEILIASSLLA